MTSWSRGVSARRAAAGAMAAIVLTIVLRPPHAPPLYDGLGFPDEPYRWAGAGATATRDPGPTPATVNAPVVRGRSSALRAASDERGPQVALLAVEGAFSTPAGAVTVTVSAVPAAPVPVPPEDGQLVSNLYRLTASADGRPLTLAPGRKLLVNLRAEQATSTAVALERWDGGTWTQVPARLVGVDVYAADLAALGSVALVRLDRAPSSALAAARVGQARPEDRTERTTGVGSGLLWIFMPGVVVVLGALAALVRLRRPTEGEHEERTPDLT